LDVTEVLTTVHKDLPPSRVDARGGSEVVAVTIALNVEAIVLPVVVSDSLSDFIEEELLLSLVLSPSLKDHVGSTKHLSYSVEWKLRYKIEWSIDMESKFFIESLSLNLISFIKIKYSPLLSSGSVIVKYLNWVSFNIFTSSDIKCLSVGPVDELILFVLEELEPSRVSAPDLHVVGLTCTLDIPRLIVISGFDSK
jgi:hypothetical protein